MVYDADPSLGVNLDGTGVGQQLLVTGVVVVGERPLPDHVRVGRQLVLNSGTSNLRKFGT